MNEKLARAVLGMSAGDNYQVMIEFIRHRYERVRDNLESLSEHGQLRFEQGRAKELKFLIDLADRADEFLSKQTRRGFSA